MDIEKVAKAIEADAGEALPSIRQALREAQAIRAGKASGRVATPAQILLRSTRAKLGLSQAEFAARIDTPASTLRDWEQGRFAPPGAVLRLAQLLAAHPRLSKELAAA